MRVNFDNFHSVSQFDFQIRTIYVWVTVRTTTEVLQRKLNPTFFDKRLLNHDLWKLKEQRKTSYKTIRGHWRLRTQQSTQEEH